MKPTDGPLGPRHFGVDGFEPAVKTCIDNGAMAVWSTIAEFASLCAGKSWDVVLLLDVLEHQKKQEALDLLTTVDIIARRLIIAFTPDGFVKQEPYDEWEHGKINPWEEHKCGLSESDFTSRGYTVQRKANRSIQAGEFEALFAVKEIK